jgi:hypothetical protein
MKPKIAKQRMLAGLCVAAVLGLASSPAIAGDNNAGTDKKPAKKAEAQKPLSTPDSHVGVMTTGSLIPKRLRKRDGVMVGQAPGYVITASQIERSGSSSLPQLLRTTIPR